MPHRFNPSLHTQHTGMGRVFCFAAVSVTGGKEDPGGSIMAFALPR